MTTSMAKGRYTLPYLGRLGVGVGDSRGTCEGFARACYVSVSGTRNDLITRDHVTSIGLGIVSFQGVTCIGPLQPHWLLSDDKQAQN